MSESVEKLGPSDPTSRAEIARIGLAALFVTALATSQVTAAKILALPLPFELPALGAEILLPGAALAYALTFFASDCYSELYGRRSAQVLVNVAFAMNFVVLALVWSTLAAPGLIPEVSEAFEVALGPATNVVIGSLLAYVVSQNWDVFVFHEIRDRTGPGKLWLRNLASTATSQVLDTVIFIGVAFVAAPALLGIGMPTSLGEAALLIVGQYLLKLLIAVVDTPFVYLVVRAVRE